MSTIFVECKSHTNQPMTLEYEVETFAEFVAAIMCSRALSGRNSMWVRGETDRFKGEHQVFRRSDGGEHISPVA